MTASISSLVIGLFRFSISCLSGLGVGGFPQVHPFLDWNYLIYWHIAAHNRFFFKRFYLFIHERHTQREREREREAGSMQGARRGTRS